MKLKSKVSIFDFNCLISYLDSIASDLRNQGLSDRKIITIFGVNSPGYLKALIERKRKIGPKLADKIMDALALNKKERNFFTLLNKLEQDLSAREKSEIYENLIFLRQKKNIRKIDDVTFFSTWLNSVILEMLEIKTIKTAAHITNRLKGVATSSEVANSLAWLQKKGFITIANNIISKEDDFEFETYDDLRRILEIQANHLFFLNLAKHRLAHDLSKREYQSLTIAINTQRLPEVKERIRQFIHDLNAEFSFDKNADEVYQVELAVFKI